MMRLAIFDFDGTLYEKETFNTLMDYLKEHPTYGKRYKKFYLSILIPYLSYKAKVYPEGNMKANLMKKYLNALSGLSEEQISTYFTEIADQMKGDFHQEVVQRIESHAQDGYYTMIVSGAFTPILNAAVAELPVDQVIGTDIPITNGTFKRNSEIYHVQDTRKKVVIHDALKGKEIDWEGSYAYGDSYVDLSVLDLVGHPVAVRPDKKLRRIAVDKEWVIIE